jgi:RNA polymerase subunit RPABC4/transcription elongation factor Spt4
MTLVEWPGGSWESTLGIAAALVVAYIGLMWLALVFWTVRDAHQRTRSTVTQLSAGLLVLFFFLPGHWLYLILRPRLTLAERYERTLEAEAVLFELSERAACPRCNRRVKDDFVHCPSCRATLKRACSRCQRPMDFAWVMCPTCGLEPRRERVRTEEPAQPAKGAPVGPPRPAVPVAATVTASAAPAVATHGPRVSPPRKPRRGMGPIPRPGVAQPGRQEEQPQVAAATVAQIPVTTNAQMPVTTNPGSLTERGLAGGTPGS